ncbi:MAG: ribonuclease H [Bacteroidota bacterium]|nr:ribonuclease H [Bacteroidota bacterium]
MNYHLLTMDIIDHQGNFFIIEITLDDEHSRIQFSPDKKAIFYLDRNNLSNFLQVREFQLRKILHNKRPESFYKGFSLKFVLTDSLPDPQFYDRTKITHLDNRNNKHLVTKRDKKTEGIPELFTDGSFNHQKQTGGFALLIKEKPSEYKILQVQTKRKGNNLIELLAVIKGLEYLKDKPALRIVTDSQYVIKGISEWLPVWKINDFYTANGTRAKNITDWKEIDRLIAGKYIELEWVKSHTDHFENTLCDLKAKSITKYNNHEKN